MSFSLAQGNTASSYVGSPSGGGPPVPFPIQLTRIDLYVAPSGDDANNGTSPASPVLTLAGAYSKLQPFSQAPMVIHVARYPGLIPVQPPAIVPLSAGAELVFLGDGAGQAGEDGWDIVHAGVISLSTADTINITVPITVDSGQGHWLELTIDGELEYRQIRNNTASQIMPVAAYSDIPTVASAYRILKPSAAFDFSGGSVRFTSPTRDLVVSWSNFIGDTGGGEDAFGPQFYDCDLSRVYGLQLVNGCALWVQNSETVLFGVTPSTEGAGSVVDVARFPAFWAILGDDNSDAWDGYGYTQLGASASDTPVSTFTGYAVVVGAFDNYDGEYDSDADWTIYGGFSNTMEFDGGNLEFKAASVPFLMRPDTDRPGAESLLLDGALTTAFLESGGIEFDFSAAPGYTAIAVTYGAVAEIDLPFALSGMSVGIIVSESSKLVIPGADNDSDLNINADTVALQMRDQATAAIHISKPSAIGFNSNNPLLAAVQVTGQSKLLIDAPDTSLGISANQALALFIDDQSQVDIRSCQSCIIGTNDGGAPALGMQGGELTFGVGVGNSLIQGQAVAVDMSGGAKMTMLMVPFSGLSLSGQLLVDASEIYGRSYFPTDPNFTSLITNGSKVVLEPKFGNGFFGSGAMIVSGGSIVAAGGLNCQPTNSGQNGCIVDTGSIVTCLGTLQAAASDNSLDAISVTTGGKLTIGTLIVTGGDNAVNVTGGGEVDFIDPTTATITGISGNELEISPGVGTTIALALPAQGSTYSNAGGGSRFNRNF